MKDKSDKSNIDSISKFKRMLAFRDLGRFISKSDEIELITLNE